MWAAKKLQLIAPGDSCIYQKYDKITILMHFKCNNPKIVIILFGTSTGMYSVVLTEAGMRTKKQVGQSQAVTPRVNDQHRTATIDAASCFCTAMARGMHV